MLSVTIFHIITIDINENEIQIKMPPDPSVIYNQRFTKNENGSNKRDFFDWSNFLRFGTKRGTKTGPVSLETASKSCRSVMSLFVPGGFLVSFCVCLCLFLCMLGTNTELSIKLLSAFSSPIDGFVLMDLFSFAKFENVATDPSLLSEL